MSAYGASACSTAHMGETLNPCGSVSQAQDMRGRALGSREILAGVCRYRPLCVQTYICTRRQLQCLPTNIRPGTALAVYELLLQSNGIAADPEVRSVPAELASPRS